MNNNVNYVNVVFKTNNNLIENINNRITNCTHIPRHNNYDESNIYTLTCICNKFYISKINKSLKVRCKEFQK